MKTSIAFAGIILAVSINPLSAASYTLNIQAGYNLIANQLDSGSNRISQILTSGVVEGMVFSKFNNALQTYSSATYDAIDGWSPGTIVLNPGEGAYLRSPRATNLTFTGSPHIPVLPLTLGPGTYLLSRQTNAPGTFQDIVGSGPRECTIVHRFNPGAGRDPNNFSSPHYTTHTFRRGVWTPSVPTFAVGESAWFILPGISSQPVTQRTTVGGTVTFSVTAAGSSPLTYQWFKGSNAMNVYSTPSLTIRNAQPEDVDRYWVRVSDGCFTLDSTNASLIITNYSYTLALAPGFSPIANQLHVGNNTVNEVLPSVPEGTILYFWNETVQRYDSPLTYLEGVGWIGGGSDGNTAFSPGTGAILRLTTGLPNLTFRGEIRPGSRVGPCEFSGFRLLASPTPKFARYQDINGVMPCPGAGIHVFDPSINIFRGHFFLRGEWSDGEPIAGIGQSVFVSYRPPLTNVGTSSPFICTNAITFSDPIANTANQIVLYQWRRNGVAIPGATNTSIAITNAQQFTNFGVYTLSVQSRRRTDSPLASNIVDVPDVSTGPPHVLKCPLPTLPAVDDFNQSVTNTPQSAQSFTGTVNNATATIQTGEPKHAGKIGGHSLWFTWQAPQAGFITFRTIGSSLDTLLAAYTGNSFAGLTNIASDDDSGGFGSSLIRFFALQGVRYRIAVDGYAGAVGDIVLNWQLVPTTNAIPRFITAPTNQSVFEGTPVVLRATIDRPLGATSVNWFFNGSILASGSNGITLSVTNQTNLVLSIARALPSHVGVYWAVLTNAGEVTSVQSAPAVFELGNQPGFISEDKFEDLTDAAAGTGGAFLLSGGNDDSRTKGFISVAAGSLINKTINNLISTSQDCESDDVIYLGTSSRWLNLRPSVDGTMTIDTRGSTNDTTLSVYQGDSLCRLSGLVRLLSDDNSGLDGKTSRLAFAARPDTNYFVAVDAKPPGNIVVNFTLLPQPKFGENVLLMAPPTNQVTRFQWMRNGVELSGQTNFTLRLMNFQPANCGTYSISTFTSSQSQRITNDIAFLSPIELRFTNTLPVTNAQILATNSQILVIGSPSSNYVVEAGTELGTNVEWSYVSKATLSGSGAALIKDANATNYAARFYRAKSP